MEADELIDLIEQHHPDDVQQWQLDAMRSMFRRMDAGLPPMPTIGEQMMAARKQARSERARIAALFDLLGAHVNPVTVPIGSETPTTLTIGD